MFKNVVIVLQLVSGRRADKWNVMMQNVSGHFVCVNVRASFLNEISVSPMPTVTRMTDSIKYRQNEESRHINPLLTKRLTGFTHRMMNLKHFGK